MAVSMMRVTLLAGTPNAAPLIYAACRQCYSPRGAAELYQQAAPAAEQYAFIRTVVAAGHESPLEHAALTFAVEGVSRALTHQLVRHRIASYSQQSQRYVKQQEFDFIVPPRIAADKELEAEFFAAMRDIQQRYNRLLARFAEQGITGETANQDARFVLPQAAETKIVLTMNCRELRHFFHHRCCRRAQWEIRALAEEMLRLSRDYLECVFFDAGPRCESLGYCPESAKHCCGRYPPGER